LPSDRRLMSAAIFQLLHRNARKLHLHRARPTLHMLIQRRLRAKEERSLIDRDRRSHQKLLCGAVPQTHSAPMILVRTQRAT
jgi:hypothetical protein